MLTDERPKDDLVERINALADCSYWANAGWDIPGDATQVIGRLAVKAAARIREQEAEIARLQIEDEIKRRAASAWMSRAERAEQKLLETDLALQMVQRDLERGKAGAEKELTDTTERLARAEAEREQMRKDAERYRWLRVNPLTFADGLYVAWDGYKLDIAIDAAMKEKP